MAKNTGRVPGERGGVSTADTARGAFRATDDGDKYEPLFSDALAEVLQGSTARWRAGEGSVLCEATRQGRKSGPDRRKRPDILIDDPGSPPLAIECSYDGADADKDARERLGFVHRDGGEVRASIAVQLQRAPTTRSTKEIRESLRGGERLRYALHQMSGARHLRWPERGFVEGDIHDLVGLVSAAGLPKEDVESAAGDVADLIVGAAGCLRTLPARARKAVERRIRRGSAVGAMETAMVLWLDALLTQQRLQRQGVAGIPVLGIVSGGRPMPSEQARAWRKIWKMNWRDIFEPAIDVLETAGNSAPAETADALAKLVKAVERIEAARLGQHINIGAELFPKLSADRKQAAAFYTQPATAELLAALTIRPGDLREGEWGDSGLFSTRSLADLACGTGTLLRAGYRKIQALHEMSGGTAESVSALHRQAMETGLVGADISPIAAHLTSASLAAIGHGDAYGQTRIAWVGVGGARNAAGSLEYLAGPDVVDLFHRGAGRAAGGRRGGGRERGVANESVDWLLMNPPYSRTRGGQSAFDIAGLSPKQRERCQKRWQDLIRGKSANAKAGMAASFLVLAHEKVKVGGRIGFVLPLTAAFADSWAGTRAMVERWFEDITAIAVAPGRALGRDALSADTGMEEMLLVATRRKQAARAPIKCVTIFDPVTRMGVAGEIARAVSAALDETGAPGTTRPVMAGGDEIGSACVFSPDAEGGEWSPLSAVRGDLALAADTLSRGHLEFGGAGVDLTVGMTTLDELFEVGPTHHLIGHVAGKARGGEFEFIEITDDGGEIGRDRALWHAKSKAQRSLVVLPTHKGVALHTTTGRGGSASGAKKMRAARSTLFYARNMRWTSQALLAATTKRAVMGGRAWTSLQHDDERVRMAFALWANSTFGMLVHWTRGQRTQAGRSTTQIGALKRIPCPRLGDLGEGKLDQAAAKFRELAQCPLSPAKDAHMDVVRREIDSAVIGILGLPGAAAEIADDLRELWCREPSVTG